MRTEKLFIFLFLLLVVAQCTDLSENNYSSITKQDYYKNEKQLQSGLADVYYSLTQVSDGYWMEAWHINEITTPLGVVPVRASGGWYDGGFRLALKFHTWTATNTYLTSFYQGYYSTVAHANSFLKILRDSNLNIENKKSITAEVKAIRAFCYWKLMDLYGNVPIVTEAQLNKPNLPTNASRKKVYDFVVKQLKTAIENLPSLKEVDQQKYYPRVAKETAESFLVKLYLNSKVYTGQSQWEKTIAMSNKVINSGVYHLASNIGDNFKPENQNSPEIIFALSQDNNAKTIGGAENINQFGLRPPLKEKFNIPFTPYGGPSATSEAYKMYNKGDARRTFILTGTQYSQNGDSLTTLTPIKDINNAPANAGYVSIKYKPDPEAKIHGGRGFGRADYVILRYADILMSKAEALFRTGAKTEATKLINKVRARNFNPSQPIKNLSLHKIMVERAKEFFWEAHYRSTLIRFGKFTDSYKFKPKKDPQYRTIFPIPQIELQSNPNLKQNPGY